LRRQYFLHFFGVIFLRRGSLPASQESDAFSTTPFDISYSLSSVLVHFSLVRASVRFIFGFGQGGL
jgi:hypothetical protein